MPATDTLWKLVEAQCKQLGESVAATRTGFIVALTWSFIWAWSLCTYEFSYIDTLYKRYQLFYALSESDKPEQKLQFLAICKGWGIVPPEKHRVANGHEVPIDDAWLLPHCTDLVKRRFDDLFHQRSEDKLRLPGGIVVPVSDMDIIGNLGLLLILGWSFYAIRRENHAIRTLVDLDERSRTLRINPDERSRKLRPWRRRSLILVPQIPELSSLQLAYAYHAVPHSFFSVFSVQSDRDRDSNVFVHITRAGQEVMALVRSFLERHLRLKVNKDKSSVRRPPNWPAILLCFFPAAVASSNLLADLYDEYIFVDGTLELSVHIRDGVEFLLVAVVWGISRSIVRFALDTNHLLNGWYLASRDVWREKWDDPRPAPPVRVDFDAQSATICQPEEQHSLGNLAR